MNQIPLVLFRRSSQLLYKVLGPEKSTKLSQSTIGKKLVNLFVSSKNNIYMGSEGIKLKLSKSEALASGIVHLGIINPYETALIKKVLQRGDTFIDIGAYVDGWHSLVASKIVGKDGKIFTFEPVPEYYKTLSKNIKLNKYPNITAEKLAISDKNGKQTFYIGGLASTLYKDHLGEGSKEVNVTTTTLDSYVKKKRIGRVALIKIDAEGAELDVIIGAKKLLRRKEAPDLMVEVSDVYLHHGKTSESKLLNMLKNLGYKAYSITDKGLGKYVKKSEGRELMNVYFSKKTAKELPLV